MRTRTRRKKRRKRGLKATNVGKYGDAGVAETTWRVRLPVLLPREAPEPAGRQGTPALPGLRLKRAFTWLRPAVSGGTRVRTARRLRSVGRYFGGMTKDAGAERAADRLLDLAVYAPVGLVLSVVEAVPELALKGRARLGPQVQ